MSGITQHARTAVAELHCDKCRETWTSRLYEPIRWGDEVKACKPAWSLGWRVYAAGRGQRTYCPENAPSVLMYLVHGDPDHTDGDRS